MAKAEIRPATIEDCADLAPRMRQSDVDEVMASDGLSPLSALEIAFKASSEAWAGLIDGVVVCMFGVCPVSLLSGDGSPWMLGSDDIEQHQKLFLRRCRPVVAGMAQSYKSLHNHVDCRNETSIRWLKWLGFTMGEPEPYGIFGLPFRRFWLES